MTDLCKPIYDSLDPSWGTTMGRGGKSQDANVALNSSSPPSNSRPESPTSAALAGVQGAPGSKEAQARPARIKAGRDSQSTKRNMNPLLALDGDWRKDMVKGNIDPASDTFKRMQGNFTYDAIVANTKTPPTTSAAT